MKRSLRALGLGASVRKAGWVALLALIVGAVVSNSTVEARVLKTRQQDDAGSPSDQVRPAPIQKGGPVQKGDACAPRIRYHHHCSLRKTCCCSCGTIKQVLLVEDPCCCGKMLAVPVCLPDCCDDCPKTDGHGVLGRGVTTFRWCCGYKVKVVVDRCGDIAVHSYGR